MPDRTSTVASVHIASTHRAFDARIFGRECVTLAEAGYDVTLIVPHDRDEFVRGVRIRSVPPPASGADRLVTTLWRLFSAALREDRHAVFHVHDAEFLPYAVLLACTGRRVIYDAHEHTPRQVLTQRWIPAPLRPLASLAYEVLERIAGHLFTHIIAAWPAIADRYPSGKVTMVRNYPASEAFSEERIRPFADRDDIVIYAGGITEDRGLFELLELADSTRDHSSLRFALAGAFYPKELEDRARRHTGWDRVDYYGWLSRDELVELLGRARVGYCVLRPTPQHLVNYPNKLFEYMAAGLPIVASDFPVWRGIVESAGCGVLVDPSDAHAVKREVLALLDDPTGAGELGRRGREAFLRERNWEGESRRLLEVYRQLGG